MHCLIRDTLSVKGFCQGQDDFCVVQEAVERTRVRSRVIKQVVNHVVLTVLETDQKSVARTLPLQEQLRLRLYSAEAWTCAMMQIGARPGVMVGTCIHNACSHKVNGRSMVTLGKCKQCQLLIGCVDAQISTAHSSSQFCRIPGPL